jgi:hypothetical protein
MSPAREGGRPSSSPSTRWGGPERVALALRRHHAVVRSPISAAERGRMPGSSGRVAPDGGPDRWCGGRRRRRPATSVLAGEEHYELPAGRPLLRSGHAVAPRHHASDLLALRVRALAPTVRRRDTGSGMVDRPARSRCLPILAVHVDAGTAVALRHGRRLSWSRSALSMVNHTGVIRRAVVEPLVG